MRRLGFSRAFIYLRTYSAHGFAPSLEHFPLRTLIVGLLAVFELYSVGLMLLARRKWGIDRLKLNNEVAGFKFSVIGVLYAVLLAKTSLRSA